MLELARQRTSELRSRMSEARLDSLGRTAAECAGRCDVLVCPELFATGYNIGPHNVRRHAEPIDGMFGRGVMRIAREPGMATAEELLLATIDVGDNPRARTTLPYLEKPGRAPIKEPGPTPIRDADAAPH